MHLKSYREPNDLKGLDSRELKELSDEIREFIIQRTSENGGHLSSNLGTVELTIALFKTLCLPKDKIIWDVGHQSYTHKILSGRKDMFSELRQYKGLSGFPRRDESPYDSFGTGHSSTSISAGLGICQARDLKNEDFTVVSVIGDGAMTGGLSFEGLNNASRLKSNFIILLNDNNMSISPNVGGMNEYLNFLRTGVAYNTLKENVENSLEKLPGIGKRLIKRIKRYKNGIKQFLIPGMLFEEMGITYLGPVNGHDIGAVERAVREAKNIKHAVIVHVITQKGRGYLPAEKNPSAFHGVAPFDIKTGLNLEKAGKSYTDIAGEELLRLAEYNPDIVALTAAMPDGTGLGKFKNKYPDRFFDVGIAEAHAVTSAAAMASEGLKPFFAVYSSFLQRGYDQIVHDVCLQRLNVTFLIDRAGIVGQDGETHQGIFDISYLSSVPNMTIMAPKNGLELRDMLKFAEGFEGPLSIRYPRGEAYTGLSEYNEPVRLGKSEIIKKGSKIAFVALGSMVGTAYEVSLELEKKGINVSLVNARFVKPLDHELLRSLIKEHKEIVTFEENVILGGFGQILQNLVSSMDKQVHVTKIGLPDSFIGHGDCGILKHEFGIDVDSIMRLLEEKGII